MFLKKIMFLIAVGMATPALAQKCDVDRPAISSMDSFTVGPEGATIVNTKSQQVWLRCSLGMRWTGSSCDGNSLTYDMAAAEAAVAELNANRVAGYSRWRLPKIDELSSLVEQRCFGPAINLVAFPNVPGSGFWSGTVAPGLNARSWIVHFLHGQRYIANNQQAWRLLPVADQ